MTRALRLRSQRRWVLATIAVASATLTSAAESRAQAQVDDRRHWIKTATTDDPRRIPIKSDGTNQPVTVLTGGLVFDAKLARTTPGTVIIEGNKIAAIWPAGKRDWPDHARVIDIAGKTILPGLIDLHVHLTYPDGDTPIDRQASEGDGVLRGARNLRWMLEAGITSVRDLNGVADAPYILADWSAANRIPAPRVFTAGHIITGTGGHATERPVSPSHGPDYAWERDGADAWRGAVRETFKRGASVIKVASHFSPDEIAAAVDEAHRLGLKVTCDCETVYTALAVDAGVDIIEHPLPRTDATIRAMATHHTAAVPTLQVYQNVLDRAGGFYGSTSRRFTLTAQADFVVFRKMKAAGIVMGVGTDTIGDANQLVPNVYLAELQWFIRGGYSAAEALRAATLTNAEILDMDDKLGSIAPGKLADILIVDGRPDLDIEALRKVDKVFRDGILLVDGGQIVVPRHQSRPLAKAPPFDAVR
ncbi:amidohydrolase family protein [Sphingomonas pokkalii]|uniref:Amidohydrolase family protein n=1 Tax=Sphingomonas pokkalii TaxID=2175090 RepID=A0A2U0SJR7_9SPHN|nr:amidohydrolase family protein [Sphingomonas pokkalii]